MIILSVESTCDETAVALVRDGREILTDQIFSQADLHAVYGGVVPEIASRSHVEVIYQLADRAIAAAGIRKSEIDAVAVSFAPGLIGAVLVGVNFAKSVATALGVPLIPVHHIRGHMAANYLAYPELTPPFICLAISGGNSLIVGNPCMLIVITGSYSSAFGSYRYFGYFAIFFRAQYPREPYSSNLEFPHRIILHPCPPYSLYLLPRQSAPALYRFFRDICFK